MTNADAQGNGFAAIPSDLAGVERMCEQLYTTQDAATRQRAESALLSMAASPRHLTQATMILENSKVSYSSCIFVPHSHPYPYTPN